MNCRAITMMFVRLGRAVHSMHCGHMVNVSVDLRLWLDSPMVWTPWHQACPATPSRLFLVPPGREVGMDVRTMGVISKMLNVKLLLTLNGRFRIARYLCSS